MAGLREMPAISGLEIGFYDDIHLHDPQWFLEQLRPDWKYILTSIPGTMNQLAKRPDFGLASLADSGRDAAWAFAQNMRAAVETLHQHFGKHVVRAVVLHSAPKLSIAPSADQAARFRESLEHLASFDWHGAELWVEHCDSPIPGGIPAKGFLTFEQEIQAIQSVQNPKTPLGMLINWGRSALERRDPYAPLKHVEVASRKGLLRALMFSGCTEDDQIYGAWADTHAPFAPTASTTGWKGSLMTQERASECIAAASKKGAVKMGLKIQALPAQLTVAERLHLISDSLKVLASAQVNA